MINAIAEIELSAIKVGAQTFKLPEDAYFLTTQIKNSAIHMWFEVEKDAPLEERQFQVFLTGDVTRFEDHHVYRGTVQFEHIDCHIYEIRRERKGGYIKGAGQ